MPNTRIMLWVALAAILFLNYEAWMRDYPASVPQVTQTTSGNPAGSSTLGDTVPQAPAAAPQVTDQSTPCCAGTAESYVTVAASVVVVETATGDVGAWLIATWSTGVGLRVMVTVALRVGSVIDVAVSVALLPAGRLAGAV